MSAFLDAVLAAVVAGRSDPRVYKINAVPESPRKPYTVLSLTRDLPSNYTLDAVHGSRDYRIGVQSFGETADGALAYDAAADDALLDQRLSVAGFESGPIRQQIAAAMTRDPDDNGVVGVTSAYIFTTTKEQA